MSTYYYLVCHTHKVYCNGASQAIGGIEHLSDSDKALPLFIVQHCGCQLTSVSEHEIDDLHGYAPQEGGTAH